MRSLARLKADVAKLEAKQTASAGSKTLEEKAAAKKADPLEKRRKEHERAMMEKAERRRQELFGYRPTFDRTQYASQANRKRLAPLSLYEDPEFWSLEAPDRHQLELMPPEKRLHYGFGPYPADAAQDATLEDKLRSFQCTAAPSLPGALQVFERIDNARAVQLPDLTQLGEADLPAAQEILDEAAFALQDELTMFAIEHYGANALLSFAIEGPLPVQDEELVAQGYLYELAASGVPALDWTREKIKEEINTEEERKRRAQDGPSDAHTSSRSRAGTPATTDPNHLIKDPLLLTPEVLHDRAAVQLDQQQLEALRTAQEDYEPIAFLHFFKLILYDEVKKALVATAGAGEKAIDQFTHIWNPERIKAWIVSAFL
ncbi:hypothetical protein B0A53_03248 [Rhodotorula sp. CCFEE 5036]|nr:hypothetical protein B0A53_03248 [Rhodotorula sp. CCFEE 5036]